MQELELEFYDSFINFLVKDAYINGSQLAEELIDAGEPTTLTRELSLQLFSMEWLNARLPWLRWKVRQFADKTLGSTLHAILEKAEDDLRKELAPYHTKVPFGIDHYFMTIDAYERGESFGPGGFSAGPGIGILSCYKHAIKEFDPEAPELGQTEELGILMAGDQSCWTTNGDLESSIKEGLTFARSTTSRST